MKSQFFKIAFNVITSGVQSAIQSCIQKIKQKQHNLPVIEPISTRDKLIKIISDPSFTRIKFTGPINPKGILVTTLQYEKTPSNPIKGDLLKPIMDDSEIISKLIYKIFSSQKFPFCVETSSSCDVEASQASYEDFKKNCYDYLEKYRKYRKQSLDSLNDLVIAFDRAKDTEYNEEESGLIYKSLHAVCNTLNITFATFAKISYYWHCSKPKYDASNMTQEKEYLGTVINKDLVPRISDNNVKISVLNWNYKMNTKDIKIYNLTGFTCALQNLLHEEKLNAHYLYLEYVCDDDSISESKPNVKQERVQKNTDSINKDLFRKIREGFEQTSKIKENTTPNSSISQVIIGDNGKNNHCFMLKD